MKNRPNPRQSTFTLLAVANNLRSREQLRQGHVRCQEATTAISIVSTTETQRGKRGKDADRQRPDLVQRRGNDSDIHCLNDGDLTGEAGEG